jgi:ATP-dependent RNA helicase DHX57
MGKKGGSSSRGGASKPFPNSATPGIDDSYIVFTNSTGKTKAEKAAEAAAKEGPVPAAIAGAPPTDAVKKPTAKQLIGGASWTGKLPVNILAELCQKQRWEKPEYTMVWLWQSRTLCAVH